MSRVLDPAVVWRAERWERRDYPTVLSGWVVRYTADRGSGEQEQQVSASRERVIVHQVNVYSEAEGARFVDILRRAWRQHEHLARSSRNQPLAELDVISGGLEMPLATAEK